MLRDYPRTSLWGPHNLPKVVKLTHIEETIRIELNGNSFIINLRFTRLKKKNDTDRKTA